MDTHNAPKVITVLAEPVLDSIQNIVFQLIRRGFQAHRVYEHFDFLDRDIPEDSYRNCIALMLLRENGFLDKNNVGFKTIKLITESASELNITNLPCSYRFGDLEIERDLVRLVADKMLQNCLYLQEKQSHRV